MAPSGSQGGVWYPQSLRAECGALRVSGLSVVPSGSRSGLSVVPSGSQGGVWYPQSLRAVCGTLRVSGLCVVPPGSQGCV